MLATTMWATLATTRASFAPPRSLGASVRPLANRRFAHPVSSSPATRRVRIHHPGSAVSAANWPGLSDADAKKKTPGGGGDKKRDGKPRGGAKGGRGKSSGRGGGGRGNSTPNARARGRGRGRGRGKPSRDVDVTADGSKAWRLFDVKLSLEDDAGKDSFEVTPALRDASSVSSSTSTAPEASASDASPLPPREPSSLSPSPAVVYLDTLEMSREFRRAGFDQAQAETITRVVLAAVRASTEPLATRADLDKHVLSTRSDLKQYHQDVASRHREASAASKHTHDVLLAECEKLRQELRYAHEKVSTSQKLDLNLERGRIRDDLQTNAEQTSQMEIRLDREIGNMKTTIEAAKSDIIKYSLASVMSMAAVGMSLMRLLM